MNFDSTIGFTVSFDDFRIEYSDVEYDKSLNGFYDRFYNKIIYLANNNERTQDEQKDWVVISKLLGNPDTLKR